MSTIYGRNARVVLNGGYRQAMKKVPDATVTAAWK